jgi:hypothetical protein
MAGQRKQPKAAEVEVVEETAPTEEQKTEQAEDFLSEPVNQQEFNEFVVQLARNATQQEVASLEERITDLERLVSVLIGKTGAEDTGEHPKVISSSEPPPYPYPPAVEEYSPAHQGGDGTPWYSG